ncbi:hypothetical protein ACLOJK_018097 [Asimina triloba]
MLTVQSRREYPSAHVNATGCYQLGPRKKERISVRSARTGLLVHHHFGYGTGPLCLQFVWKMSNPGRPISPPRFIARNRSLGDPNLGDIMRQRMLLEQSNQKLDGVDCRFKNSKAPRCREFTTMFYR